MESLEQIDKKKGINKVLLAALAIAALVVAAGVWLLSLQPSVEQKQQEILAGSFQEGSPEFEKYTKDIVIQTDMDNIMQSPTGMGTIMMTIRAKIRNKGEKTVTGLEVKVSVVDMAGKVVRDKKLLVVPKQEEKLSPGQMIPVVATVENFSKDDDRANVRWKVTAIRIE